MGKTQDIDSQNFFQTERGDVYSKTSRRSFLKGVAILGSVALAGCSKDSGDSGAILLTPTSSSETLAEEKLIDSACRGNCAGHQCRLYAHVRNGRVVKTSMAPMIDPRYNRACLRGLSHVQRIYGPERILHPLKRVAGTPRGNPQWQRITWDEAISTIANKFNANINDPTLGKRSNMYIASTGNYGSIHGISGAPKLLFTAIEGSALAGIFDISIPVGMERVLGTTTFPFSQNNETMGLLKSKTIIIWGQNTSESQNQFFYTVMDAQEQNGAKVIAIDPAFTTSVAKADHHVNIRPASDTYFALSMIQHIIAQNWVDYEFMTLNTVSPFLVNLDSTHARYKDLLRYSHLSTADQNSLSLAFAPQVLEADTLFAVNALGNLVATTKNVTLADKPTLATGNYNHTYSGNLNELGLSGNIPVKTTFQLLKEHVQQYTPELTASHTGVAADVTKEVARQYANNRPASILPGFGAGHYGNGHHLGHALATLAAITGNFGKEGAGIGWFPSAGALNDISGSTNKPATAISSIPYIHFDKVFDAPLSTSTSTGETFGGPNELFKGISHKMRALYIASANPVSNWCEQKKIVNVLTAPGTSGNEYKVELVVVADMVMTDTAMYADIVLPVAHWFEVEDFLDTRPYIHYQEKAVEPFGEAKSDLDICRMIAQKMGSDYAQYFKMTNEQFFDYALTTERYTSWYSAITGGKVPNADNIVNAANLRRNKVMRALPGNSLNGYVTPAHRSADGKDLVIGTNNAVVTGNTKRMEFYSEKIYCFNTYGQAGLSPIAALPLFVDPIIMDEERLPTFKEPLETWPTNPHFANYPLSYYQEHTRFRTHSQWFSVPWIKELDPYPVLKISKTDATKYGNIQTGDVVKVSSPRGYVVLKAVLTDGLRPGYVNIPKGWQETQFDQFYGAAARAAGLPNAGSYQNLTSLEVNPRSINQSFFDCLVKVEKISRG